MERLSDGALKDGEAFDGALKTMKRLKWCSQNNGETYITSSWRYTQVFESIATKMLQLVLEMCI